MSQRIQKLIVKNLVNVAVLAVIGYTIKLELKIGDRIDAHYTK